MAIQVMVACNDPDNGNFVGKFHMLEVVAGSDSMEFEGPWDQGEGIVFRLEGDGQKARVGRIVVPILHYREWTGNWCWNTIWVRWDKALEIINYLGRQHAQGWHMSCGPDGIFQAFNERHQITPAEWKLNNERKL